MLFHDESLHSPSPSRRVRAGAVFIHLIFTGRNKERRCSDSTWHTGTVPGILHSPPPVDGSALLPSSVHYVSVSLTPAQHFPENLSPATTIVYVSTDLHGQQQISRGASAELEATPYIADSPGPSYFALFAQDQVLLCDARSSYRSASEASCDLRRCLASL